VTRAHGGGRGRTRAGDQAELARYFRQLHGRRPLILPNAWDSASARVMELAGAPAIASTSAGVSWARGCADGQHLERDEMIDAVRGIVRAVTVPVTADIESGYQTGSVYDVAETVQAALAVGVVGINLEDSPGRNGAPLRTPEEQAERLRAARAAAEVARIDLVINARTDVYLFGAVAPEQRFEETVRRARVYRAAGADCVFVPGVIDGDTIASLVRAIEGPVNIMAGPGAPSADQLGRLGVARVSVGPAIMQAALAATRRAARELLERGTYSGLEEAVAFETANTMFTDS
jgi:2-methylisocitrate lyase-like PEP mutase family enzyme